MKTCGNSRPFRRVDGHQLHRVVGDFFFDADVAIQLVEIAEVFDEIAQALHPRSCAPTPSRIPPAARRIAGPLPRSGASSSVAINSSSRSRSRLSSRALPQRSAVAPVPSDALLREFSGVSSLRRFDFVPQRPRGDFSPRARQAHQIARLEPPVAARPARARRRRCPPAAPSDAATPADRAPACSTESKTCG